MDKYDPPFMITNRILQSVGSVCEKVGKISIYKSLDARPHLRRNNRIKSVHSSLSIEANSLSEGTVRDILNNKPVVGPEKEIQEVKNAFAAYEKIAVLDPYSISDLKQIHGVMTYLTVFESGTFRKGAEGVFDGDRCIFMAPPPDMVPGLMEGLFSWMKENKDVIHPLILSCIFHYEFVFIHPFADGNGRMARLWQNVLLSSWNPVFQYVPIESQIEKFQSDYYDAIAKCHVEGYSTAFIEFMLEKIDEALEMVLRQQNAESGDTEYVKKILSVMEYDTPYTMSKLLSMLNLKSKETLHRNYLAPALEKGYVSMTIPEKPTSKNQRYIKT